MSEAISELWRNLPGDAYSMYLMLFAMTFALVRCSLHPTVFALAAFPGTFAHESCHLAVGAALGAKPSSMSLLPEHLGNGVWKLGGVQFTNLRWWSAPWTAMAPMLLAPISLWSAFAWAYPSWSAGDILGSAPALYVCATLLQASWPSSADFEVAFPGLVVLGALAAAYLYC